MREIQALIIFVYDVSHKRTTHFHYTQNNLNSMDNPSNPLKPRKKTPVAKEQNLSEHQTREYTIPARPSPRQGVTTQGSNKACPGACPSRRGVLMAAAGRYSRGRRRVRL